jgi:DNA polymerase III subunit delta'
MSFSSLIGNERIKKLLQRAVAEERIGQSLLMGGPRGVGKYQFAIALAQALNCEQAKQGVACGSCVPCLRIERGEHADVTTILRESKDPSFKKESKSQFIKIDQIRLMCEQAQFRPYEGRRRVFIIDDAEWLRHEAANSLLKTLEEPPSTSLVILVTSKPYVLLETVRSRCQMLNFAPLGASEIEGHLKQMKNMPADEARLRARLARGSIGRALEIDLSKYRETRNKMLEIVEASGATREIAKLISADEYVGRRIEKDEFEVYMDVFMILLDDIFHLKLNAVEASLTNADIAERLAQATAQISIAQINEWAAGIEDISRALPRNVNRQLALDAMLICG